MNKLSLIGTAAFMCTLFLCAGNVAFADTTATTAATTQSINITAANWKFAPAEITVHVNQPVTLKLTSKEGVHALASSEFGFSQTFITPGATTTVHFTPTKVGTFIIHCAIPCGQGHTNMALRVHVVAS